MRAADQLTDARDRGGPAQPLLLVRDLKSISRQSAIYSPAGARGFRPLMVFRLA